MVRSKNIKLFGSGIPLCIATTGFAGMIFDLALIFTFQSIYGYVFSWIGLLVTSFMVGAAAGAMTITSILPRIRNCLNFFIKTELTIICFSFGLPFIFLIVHPYLGSPGIFLFLRILFLVISFICGLLIGAQFPLANKIYLKDDTSLSRTAALLYGSDLLGGWLGGVVGGVVLLPVLGLLGSCVVVVLLKLSSFIIITAQSRGTA
jgi:spermidine synthase